MVKRGGIAFFNQKKVIEYNTMVPTCYCDHLTIMSFFS